MRPWILLYFSSFSLSFFFSSSFFFSFSAFSFFSSSSSSPSYPFFVFFATTQLLVFNAAALDASSHTALLLLLGLGLVLV